MNGFKTSKMALRPHRAASNPVVVAEALHEAIESGVISAWYRSSAENGKGKN